MNRIAMVAEAAAESAAATMIQDSTLSGDEADRLAKDVAHRVATRVAELLAADDQLAEYLQDKG
ncbi:hypothetical protein [Roseomonas gilardii]|uniref:hypothetical protein n=1 Tax=Roseomonas gilardii TaxID=257708 RepID=UPI0011A384C5|nr:hypothetical protein [Roseomonas gilardii]